MNLEKYSIFLVPCRESLFGIQFVRMIGVEPTCLTAPDPKSGASANFATSAGAFALAQSETTSAGAFALAQGETTSAGAFALTQGETTFAGASVAST